MNLVVCAKYFMSLLQKYIEIQHFVNNTASASNKVNALNDDDREPLATHGLLAISS